MSFLIDAKNPSIFNPNRRFAWTNITDEDFTAQWDGQVIMTIKPNQTVELPHHLANKFTDELVDRIIIGDIKKEEDKMAKNNPNVIARSKRGMSLGVPETRKVYEDKIVKEIEVDLNDPQVALMRAQVRETVMGDIARAQEKAPALSSVPVGGPSEFADLTGASAKK